MPHWRPFTPSAPLSVAICALALAACGEPPAAQDPRTQPPLVRTTTVQEAAHAQRRFTGTVAARVESNLGFRVAGKVAERLVDAGQPVKRGQVLMRLDPTDLRLAEQAQQEAVTAARARALQTAADEARYRELRGTGAISDAAYDQIKAAADAAQAQLNTAQTQARVAHNNLGYAQLLADADGLVMETLAEPGQVVAAGQPVLRLARAGAREAVIQLPETLRPPIGSTAQASLFGQPGEPVAAQLRQLSDSADRATRTFEARYVLSGALAAAPLGSTVSLTLDEGADTPGLQVPMAAVLDVGQGPGVWRVQGDPPTVHWRPVTVLQLGNEHARVSGELKPGDTIVALGAHLLKDGDAVRTHARPEGGAQPPTQEARP